MSQSLLKRSRRLSIPARYRWLSPRNCAKAGAYGGRGKNRLYRQRPAGSLQEDGCGGDQMGLFSWSVIIIFFWLAINAGLILRWRIFIGKWPSRKVLIWSNIIMIMVLIIFEILPKSNGKCKVDIIIDNRNSYSEIVINRCYDYHLTDNKTIELFDLEPHGQIGIKTQNEAKFILFH